MTVCSYGCGEARARQHYQRSTKLDCSSSMTVMSCSEILRHHHGTIALDIVHVVKLAKVDGFVIGQAAVEDQNCSL